MSISIWDEIDHAGCMHDDAFWSFIEESKRISIAEGLRQNIALGQILALETPETCAQFLHAFIGFSNQANNDNVYALLGGSDDGFHYRISGLIAMGREDYESATSRPKSFRKRVEDFEVFEYAASDAYEEPSRGALRAQGLARREKALLEAAIAQGSAPARLPSL
jgi:hypothetical protein